MSKVSVWLPAGSCERNSSPRVTVSDVSEVSCAVMPGSVGWSRSYCASPTRSVVDESAPIEVMRKRRSPEVYFWTAFMSKPSPVMVGSGLKIIVSSWSSVEVSTVSVKSMKPGRSSE